MSQPTVYIDGDQGTTGLLIHERLRGRDDLQLVTLPDTERKDPVRRAEAINAADIAILCLPDAAAREAVGFIRNPAVRVIDASSAHRTQPDWVYGFPEMASGHAQTIAHARRVTNPGCYPTGAIALLRPATGRPAAARLPGEHPCRLRVLGRRPGRRRRIRVERCFARETASGLRPRTRAQACAGDPAACRSDESPDVRAGLRCLSARHRAHRADRVAPASCRRDR